MIKRILSSYVSISSFVSALIFLIIIILIRHNAIRTDRLYLEALCIYWGTAIVIITCGFIIFAIIWLILQKGFTNIDKLFKFNYATAIIICMMAYSLPALVMAVATIKECSYENNFNRIVLIGLIFIIIPNIIEIIRINTRQPNFIFYTLFTSFVGVFLIGICLSSIITKLNMVLFKLQQSDRINITNFSITTIVLTIVLLLIVYLFFINQFPNNVLIKLTDWKVISINYTNEKGMSSYETIKPSIQTDLSKYRDYKLVFIAITGPVGDMHVNSQNYELNSYDTIIISTTEANIDRDIKNELIIDTTSRSISFYNNKMISMTLWSSLSSSQQTTIIAGLFILVAALVTVVTAIILKR